MVFFCFSYPVFGAACLYRFIFLILDDKKILRKFWTIVDFNHKTMQAILWCPLVYLFLRGVAKWKNLQDEVSYVLDCAAEAWWAHNP